MQKTTLSDWQKQVWEGMEKQGFHQNRSGTGQDDTMVRLCLIHSEVTEAVQIVKRRGLIKPIDFQEFGEELADIAIRLLDLSGCVGIDLEQAIADKMVKNMKRPYKYGTPNENSSNSK